MEVAQEVQFLPTHRVSSRIAPEDTKKMVQYCSKFTTTYSKFALILQDPYQPLRLNNKCDPYKPLQYYDEIVYFFLKSV